MKIGIHLKSAAMSGIKNRSKYFASLLADRQSDAYDAAIILADVGWTPEAIALARESFPVDPSKLRGMPDERYLLAAIIGRVAISIAMTVKDPRVAWALMTAMREREVNAGYSDRLDRMLGG